MKLIPLLLLLASCTTLTDEQREARAESLAEARDEFFTLQARCRAANGYIVALRPIHEIKRWNKWDFRSAKCALRKVY